MLHMVEVIKSLPMMLLSKKSLINKLKMRLMEETSPKIAASRMASLPSKSKYCTLT